MSAVPTFKVCPHPLEIPAALLALAPDTTVTALRHWFDFANEEKSNAGQLKSEIEQRIKDQAAGLFPIGEAACIAADAIGLDRTDRKQVRQAIWKAIDDGALVPLWDKTRTPLPLPLKGTYKSLALVRENELANLFEAWPRDAATQSTRAAPVVELAQQVAQPTNYRDRGTVLKKSALIKKYCKRWSTIERDFQDASDNGLTKSAKAPEHGNWFEGDALAWAREKGKLTESTEQPPTPATWVSGLTHKIQH